MAAAVTAANIMDEAASLLNDTAKALFDNTVLLPYLKYANEKLELLLVVNSVPVQRKISAVVVYVANATEVTVPTDMLVPVSLWESNTGANQWDLMTEKQWEPNITPLDTLNYWTFRNEKLMVPGATANRDVKIYYWRQLTAVASGSTVQDSGSMKVYLSAKTAELAARFIGENPTRADQLLMGEVKEAEDLILRMYVKNQQANRVRRRRFRSNTGSLY